MSKHVVRPGECAFSIAHDLGVPYKELWNRPGNDGLREKGREPFVLLPGDVLDVPDAVAPKRFRVSKGGTHEFTVEVPTETLELELFAGDEPLRDCPWTLRLPRGTQTGTSTSAGVFLLKIAATDDEGVLTVGTGSDRREIVLELGALHPADTVSGAQQRLNALGFACGVADGRETPQLARALRDFQTTAQLTVTGKLDADTVQRLRQEAKR